MFAFRYRYALLTARKTDLRLLKIYDLHRYLLSVWFDLELLRCGERRRLENVENLIPYGTIVFLNQMIQCHKNDVK
jgi:hypothetical protein